MKCPLLQKNVFSVTFYLYLFLYISIGIWFGCIFDGRADNQFALAQVMAWHQLGNKLFPDDLWCHIASLDPSELIQELTPVLAMSIF